MFCPIRVAAPSTGPEPHRPLPLRDDSLCELFDRCLKCKAFVRSQNAEAQTAMHCFGEAPAFIVSEKHDVTHCQKCNSIAVPHTTPYLGMFASRANRMAEIRVRLRGVVLINETHYARVPCDEETACAMARFISDQTMMHVELRIGCIKAIARPPRR